VFLYSLDDNLEQSLGEGAVFSHPRTLLLSYGLRSFMTRGYAATGVNDLLKLLQLSKGTFYHYFESKEAFCVACLDFYKETLISQWLAPLIKNKYTPLNRMRIALLYAMNYMESHQYDPGCFVGATAHEMAVASPIIKNALEDLWRHWEEAHKTVIVEAIAQGELSISASRVDALASAYCLQMQGALVESKMTQSLRPFRVLHWLFFEQLAQPAKPLSRSLFAYLSLAVNESEGEAVS
jgi:TetR/AcrR family transcriptional regulator, transcriptional repressor for nem operon